MLFAMIKSMTGYGRAEQNFDKYKITIEVKSVNNRYLDYNTKVYKQYSFLEEVVRECLTKKISRGKVDVFIGFDLSDTDDVVVTLNEETAKGYMRALTQMKELLSLSGDIHISDLTRFQDVFKLEKKEQDIEEISNHASMVLNSALDDLTANRTREGERLYGFFEASIAKVREIAKIIDARSPQTISEYTARIKERIAELLDGVPVDEARLLTEVAIFADKVNITEELIRFESHLKEFELLLKSCEPVGRKLDFTVQELNREANTMGSKCNDIEIGKAVVELKAEIEKMREQIQNIE